MRNADEIDPRTLPETVPSLVEQAAEKGWRLGFYRFQDTDRIDYFNSALVEREDGRWLVARRSRHAEWKFGQNDIVCFKEGEGHTLTQQVIPWYDKPKNTHYEDPRAIWHNGQTLISCCTFCITDKRMASYAHQCVSAYRNGWDFAGRVDPVYGNNHWQPFNNVGHEKNWTFFFHDGRPVLLYSASPHTLVGLSSGFHVVAEYKTPCPEVWDHGVIRGGTPPVRVGGEYWTFFHSSVEWAGKQRRYVMGAYAFEAKEPFRITRMMLEPMLKGSTKDRWYLGKPPVVFPCGAILKEGVWTITGGCNDLDTFWLELPHEDVERNALYA